VKRVIGTAVALGAIAVVGCGTAHALPPNADELEKEGVCEMFDNTGGDWNFAFNMAVMAVRGDTGMSVSDSAKFVRQAVNDRCPVYKNHLS
jgi:hypothetical protein